MSKHGNNNGAQLGRCDLSNVLHAEDENCLNWSPKPAEVSAGQAPELPPLDYEAATKEEAQAAELWAKGCVGANARWLQMTPDNRKFMVDALSIMKAVQSAYHRQLRESLEANITRAKTMDHLMNDLATKRDQLLGENQELKAENQRLQLQVKHYQDILKEQLTKDDDTIASQAIEIASMKEKQVPSKE